MQSFNKLDEPPVVEAGALFDDRWDEALSSLSGTASMKVLLMLGLLSKEPGAAVAVSALPLDVLAVMRCRPHMSKGSW